MLKSRDERAVRSVLFAGANEFDIPGLELICAYDEIGELITNGAPPPPDRAAEFTAADTGAVIV